MDLAAPGGVNAPAETSTADVTVVFGMVSLVRFEHMGAAVIAGRTTEQARQTSQWIRGFIFIDNDISSMICYHCCCAYFERNSCNESSKRCLPISSAAMLPAANSPSPSLRWS